MPEVRMTLWNLWKTGLEAIEASRQERCMTGFKVVGLRSVYGSINTMNPLSYVATRVPKLATRIRLEKSVVLKISVVERRDFSLS